MQQQRWFTQGPAQPQSPVSMGPPLPPPTLESSSEPEWHCISHTAVSTSHPHSILDDQMPESMNQGVNDFGAGRHGFLTSSISELLQGLNSHNGSSCSQSPLQSSKHCHRGGCNPQCFCVADDKEGDGTSVRLCDFLQVTLSAGALPGLEPRSLTPGLLVHSLHFTLQLKASQG